MKKISNQRGFTLIEVLVTVIVLSIGLLGVAGLQVTGIRNNSNSYITSQATFLAYDIADRMRANSKVAFDTVTGLPDPNSAYNMTAAPSSVTDPGFNCITAFGDGTHCSSNEIVQLDIFEWLSALAEHLPSGTGMVCIDSTPSSGPPTPAAPDCDGAGTYVAKIWWDDDKDGVVDKLFYTSFMP